MKPILKIHYITQDIPGISHPQLAKEACEAGLSLIQLRLKDRPRSEVLSIALETKAICDHYGASLVINDYLDIAIEIDADGVHLGNSDIDHKTARKKLGNKKIIGGTAYNKAEAISLVRTGIVDYIGLGTYKKTKTKPELTEFLTIVQIKDLIQELDIQSNTHIPIIIIGGIEVLDIRSLLRVGAHGIAIASLVNLSGNKVEIVKRIKYQFLLESSS